MHAQLIEGGTTPERRGQMEDEAKARRPRSDYGNAFLKALANIAAISTGTRRPISVWDVNACA